MYIHSTYQFLHKNETASFYKKLLKEISSINLRRSSKFNILSVYGAVNCLNNINYSSNTSIYIATQYGVISGVQKVVNSLNDQHQIVMPFDFLNVNANNAGFNIAKALNIDNENYLLTSNDFSFEKTLQTAFNKSKHNNKFEAIIGGVDESLTDIDNYQSYVTLNNIPSFDGSCWLYCSKIKENSIAKIDSVLEFKNKEEIENYIKNNNFDKIEYNYIEKIDKNPNYQISSIYGTQSAYDIIDLTTHNRGKLLYISKDRNGRFIAILFIN